MVIVKLDILYIFIQNSYNPNNKICHKPVNDYEQTTLNLSNTLRLQSTKRSCNTHNMQVIVKLMKGIKSVYHISEMIFHCQLEGEDKNHCVNCHH